MSIQNSGQTLKLSFADGSDHEFHAFWLRESSTDPEFRDPNTGHKLQDAENIPLDIKVSKVSERGDALELVFSDGHRASYPLSRLRNAAQARGTQELIGAKRFWDASLSPLPWFEQGALERDPAAALTRY